MRPLVFSYHGHDCLNQDYSQAGFDTRSNRSSLVHGSSYTPGAVVLIPTCMGSLWAHLDLRKGDAEDIL